MNKKKEKKEEIENSGAAGQRDAGAENREQEYLDGWKRALADYENLKKNIANEKEGERNRIKESLAHELLPVIDNFEQAINHIPELAEEEMKKLENWLAGVRFIKKQFEDVMSSLGIQKIEVGNEFDPNLHEAVGEGEGLKEVASGWKMGDKVIRPAKVIVKED